MNIIKKFPSAQAVRELGSAGLQDYMFERRLKLLRIGILTAAADGESEIGTDYIDDRLKEYLIENGYTVIKRSDFLYVISWAKENPSEVEICLYNDDENYPF